MNWPEAGAGIHYLSGDNVDFKRAFIPHFKTIQELSHDSDPWTVRLRYNLLEQILIQCKRLLPDTNNTMSDPRIQKAIEFVDQHFNRDFSMEEVAEVACISVSSLVRLFKQQTGLTVIELRNERRMALACEKLTHSLLSIAQIAELTGYSDQLYFSRCFHRHFKIPPSAFRKHYLNS